MLTSYEIPEHIRERLDIQPTHPVYKTYRNTKDINGFSVHTNDGHPGETGIEEDGFVISWEKDDPIDLNRPDHAQFMRDLIAERKASPVTILHNGEDSIANCGFAWGCTNEELPHHKCTDGTRIYYNPAAFNKNRMDDMLTLEAIACIGRRRPVLLDCLNGSDDPADWMM